MKRRKTFYELIIKRPNGFYIKLDCYYLLPVIIIVAILVRIKLGGPVLFTQNRPGKNEKNI